MRIDCCFFFKLYSSHLQSASADAVPESFGSKVFAVASSAVDFWVSFAHVWGVNSLAANVAQEARLVPCLASSTHQFGDKHRLLTSGTNLSSTPLREGLGLGRPVGRLSGFAVLFRHHLGRDVSLSLVIHDLIGLKKINQRVLSTVA